MPTNSLNLEGHSGFEVVLVETAFGAYIVRKKSRAQVQNSRLKMQHNKHNFFLKLNQKLFKVPKVIGEGTKNGLFFYEYEFVEGVTLLNYIENQPMEKITKVLDSLANIIKYFKESTERYESLGEEENLVSSLEKKISSNLAYYPEPKPMRSILSKQLKKLPLITLKTACHGDLTFDNILIDKEGNIWLIDFLELFYPHYWFDIAKLFQDIDGKWHEFKYNIRLPHNKLIYIRNYFLEKISKFDPTYLKHHNFLLVTVFLRILPYLKNEDEKKFILEKINYFVLP